MKLSFTGLNVALVLLLVPGIARAENPDLMTLIGASSAGDAYVARDNSGNDINDNASTYGLSSSDHNSFAVDYGSGGVIRGHGRCSTRAGDSGTWDNDTYNVISSNFVDSLTDETGQNGAQYCYCHLDSYTASGGSSESLSGPWVFLDDYGDAVYCADSCADQCARDLMLDGYAGYLAFRAAVFNAYAPAGGASGGNAVTTQTYVDNALAGKQARITTTGTNKLMTFGSSAGNIGTKDIVSTLGTSTTATTVPEVGPIVAGINSKQDIVNGIAGRVMAGTGTAGLLDDKLIYTAPLGFTSSLVTAQTVNSIAADAANNELTCAAYAIPGNTSSECLLWQINTDSATKVKVLEPKKGTGYCYKSSNGNQLLTACTVENKGEWGAVFTDYTVYGIAMCSSHAIPRNGNAYIQGYVPNVQNQQFIQDEYDTWVANGRQNSFGGDYCYCKITSPSGSRWVGFVYGTVKPGYCYSGSGCPYYCSNALRLNENGESAFINALYRP